MASYIRDIDWEEYDVEDDEKGYDLYVDLEKKDFEEYRKRRLKMGKYSGYGENE